MAVDFICIKIAVMLSVPIPSSVFEAQQSSNSFSTGKVRLDESVFRLSFRNYVHYSLVLQSHIPSHATIMNLSLALSRGRSDMSG